MTTRTGLALAALGAVSCAGMVWFALSPTDAPSEAAEPRIQSVARVVDDVSSALEESDEALQPARLEATLEAPLAPARFAPTFDLKDAIWVSGRVIFAPGTPADERAEVVGWYSVTDKTQEPHRARVAADGTFRLAYPAGTARGWLALEARYSYLHSQLELWFDDPIEPLVLEPELGGCVRARFRMPAGAEARASELVGSRMYASVTRRVRAQTESQDFNRHRRVTDPALVEIGGLVPGPAYNVTGSPESFPPYEVRELRIEPGVTKEIDIPLELGVVLRGTVVDEAERPIAGVSFHALVANGNDAAYIDRDDATGTDGTFELKGVKAGRIWITARASGHLAARIALEAVEGSPSDGLRFVLPRGRSIFGRVEDPQGKPAANARLEIAMRTSMDSSRQMELLGWRWEPREHTAAADGTFEITGLTEGPFELTVRSEGEPRSTARVSSVESGGEPIVVKLDGGSELRGRVVDDLRRAVPRFRVEATPVDRDVDDVSDGERVRGKRTGDDGGFAIAGLRAGAWRIAVHGNGGSVSREVTLPHDGQPFEILLPRAASVAGTVLDPMAQPVRGARVVVALADGVLTGADALATSKPTDDAGRFSLDQVPPGAVSLSATHLVLAPSAPVRVDLAPGQAASNVIVVLRPSGRITGQILDAQASPDPERHLYAYGSGTAENTSIYGESDAEGRFEFDGLPAGAYSLQSQASAAEREQIRAPDGRQDWQLLQNVTRRAQVTVNAGETTHVVLGEAPRAPVRVRGLVTRGGRPLGGAQVMATRSSHTGGPPESKTATTNDDGRYELVVGEHGDYWFRIGSGSRGTSAQRQETIPEGTDHTIDFDLPSGRISGRVLSPEGDPVREFQVQLRASAPRPLASKVLQTNFGWSSTDERGAFAFDGLLPGDYTVSAQDRFFVGDDAGPRYGPVTSDEIRIEESSTRDDVVLRLELAARIEALVSGPGGESIAAAEVFAFYETGKRIERNDSTTDAAGRVRLGGLPPRPVLLFARKDSFASAVTGPVRARAGELDVVTLELRPATFADIVVEGPDGPRPMPIVVRDERGIEFTSLWSRARSPSSRAGTNTKGAVIGPLPPGRYRAMPRDRELESHGADFVVAGEDQVTVRIKLPK